jgi:hypothetical protein
MLGKRGFSPKHCKTASWLVPEGVWHAICEGIQRFDKPTNADQGLTKGRRRISVTADNTWTLIYASKTEFYHR